jgi:hypothetical protein
MPPAKKVASKSVTPSPLTPAPVPMPAQVVEKSEVKGSGTSKSSPAASAPRVPTQAEIQKRAFEIYAGRGYAPGNPVADWLEAERQLKAGL